MRLARILIALLLTACGSRGPKPEAADHGPPVIEMEPIVVEYVGDAGGEPKTESFDAAELFEAARGRFDGQRFGEAEAIYAKLLRYFPKSRFTRPALYNRGLCLEFLGRHGLAAQLFRRYAQLAESKKERRDGEFRYGFNLVKTGDHPTAIALYTRLLTEPDLGPADRAECRVRRATSLLRLRRYGEAERDLRQSFEDVKLAYDNVVLGNDLYAEGHFRRGELYQSLFHEVKLKLPVEKMRVDLADKARFFRQAQSSFLAALNVHHGYWATAAGLKLGELYEEFYRDILDAERPADFNEEERAFYFVELRKALRPLLEQSLTIYEKNITMSQRIGAENEWVNATEERLARLRGLLEASHRAEGGHEQP